MGYFDKFPKFIIHNSLIVNTVLKFTHKNIMGTFMLKYPHEIYLILLNVEISLQEIFIKNLKAMEKLMFETNVECSSLLHKIYLVIRKFDGIKKWKIDLDSIYNILIIEGKCLDHQQIIKELGINGIEAQRLYEE